MEKSMKTKIEYNEKLPTKVDDLGRVTIEYKTRETLGIKEGDKFEIYLENDCIILRELMILIEKEKIIEKKYIINEDTEIDVQKYKIKKTLLDINDIGHYVRTIDLMGKIVIPIELRKKLNLRENDILEISDRGNNIILNKKKYRKDSKKIINTSKHS